ncbi:hypothetical protein [Solitalea lacus]|uniref:hypothetical protein n=1 Tax=Solitalea lacus TaxID=2911172 RepID=UPI001EDA164B|nr:hypothetical protein [Solitalea lacus]UKJ06785.1 hypothetical protein L2B55_14760 [Solitalea lacus]
MLCAVLAKFIGEKLVSPKSYSTTKLIALYSQPKGNELRNNLLFNKFYYEDGKQKPIKFTEKGYQLTIEKLKESSIALIVYKQTKQVVVAKVERDEIRGIPPVPPPLQTLKKVNFNYGVYLFIW